MSDLVDPNRIEKIVGVKRHAERHYAKAVSAEQTVYVLHSQECKDSGRDLRRCPYSRALDRGIDPSRWPEDEPVWAVIVRGRLVPQQENK